MLNLSLFFLPEGGLSEKTPASETKDEDNPKKTDGMTRQQWKNKMKNKRKCKNKYRQNKPEEEENKTESADNHKPQLEVKTNSHSNNDSGKISQTAAAQNKKMEKECKPQKRKKTDATDTVCASEKQTLKEEKQPALKKQKTKEDTAGKVSKSATDEHEPEVEITHDQKQVPMKAPKAELSKAQSLKREKLRKMLNSQKTEQRERPAEQRDEQPAPTEEVKLDRSASLRSRMEQRLESARFRYINEVLYSTSSGEAKRMFSQDPQAFWVYHKGYTAQVQRWPANPVDTIISYIQQK